MKKSLFTAFAVGLGLTASLWAQVPSYVPTDGLVGWWPFNGNANDESGNGNNGTVNGATLTTDRFGNVGKAYSFDGVDDFIDVGNNVNIPNYTITSWVNIAQLPLDINMPMQIVSKISTHFENISVQFWKDPSLFQIQHGNGSAWIDLYSFQNIILNQWKHITASYDGNEIKLYINGQLESSLLENNYADILGFSTYFGSRPNNQGISSSNIGNMNGKLDDIGIWNRALTPQEILDLYNSVNCANDLTISPTLSTQNIGGNSTFIATTSDPSPAITWQSDLGQGFQTLTDVGSYSGTNTDALTISNVQLANHNQQIRAISTSGNCVDTSDVALLSISNTCTSNVTIYDTLTTNVYDTLTTNITVYDTLTTNVYDTLIINIYDTLTTNIMVYDTLTTNVYDTLTTNIYDTLTTNITVYDTVSTNVYDTLTTNITVYDTITTNITIYDTLTTNVFDTTYITVSDTLLTTVTDTLIINTTLSLPAPNNENTILIYPNPASDHITIDNGNFAAMTGYSIKITNNAGQQVFQSAINQQQFYVDLSTWSGNGLYFVNLIDPQNNTVTVRKIVLQ